MLEGSSGEPPAQSNFNEHIAQSCVQLSFEYLQIYPFTISADCLKKFVSFYTFLLHGFRQQQDAAKAFWRLSKPKPSSLSLSQHITCSVLWIIWRTLLESLWYIIVCLLLGSPKLNFWFDQSLLQLIQCHVVLLTNFSPRYSMPSPLHKI